tara:strand:- start:466 stop:1368 length:903 start_codon:yes stop_codon:yes gene_type:complete
MKTNEDLLRKWLDNELDASELQAFNALEDSALLEKISLEMQSFKAPEYDSVLEFEKLKSALKSPVNLVVRPNFRAVWSYAAALLIGLGLFFTVRFSNTSQTTDMAEIKSQRLPDSSMVTVNAASTLTYNTLLWRFDRQLELDGEAYFEVVKGSDFTVNTHLGSVTVVGTKFKVKQRSNYFEVVCYEGTVSVSISNEIYLLNQGERLLKADDRQDQHSRINEVIPSWIQKSSAFTAAPIQRVLNELERQYAVKILTNGIDTRSLFTGRFTHDNLELALKSITLPMGYVYSVTPNSIVVSVE